MSGPAIIPGALGKYIKSLEDKERIWIILTVPKAKLVLKNHTSASSSQMIEISAEDLNKKYVISPDDSQITMISKLASYMAAIEAIVDSYFYPEEIPGFRFPSGKFDHKSDMSWMDPEGGKRKNMTPHPIHVQSGSGDLEDVKKLLENGADLERRDEKVILH